MSLEEKVAQLTSVDIAQLITDGRLDAEKLSARLSSGCAALTGLAASMADAEAFRDTGAQLTEFLRSQTRLGIPAWICESQKSLARLLAAELTIQPLAMAASFAPALVAEFANRYRSACRDLAVDQLLAPLLAIDSLHNERQRGQSAGADAYLAGRIAVAYLRGMRGDSEQEAVLACADGFVAQSICRFAAADSVAVAAEGGVRIGRRELREIYAEPYSAAIREAGLAALIVADLTIDGVPCTGAREVLNDLLREELGYKGLVISVAGGIGNLAERHRVAADRADAAVQALTAGVDIEMDGRCFREELPQAVIDGSVSEELVDRAVRRVLKSKLQQGLFDRQARQENVDAQAQAPLTPSFEAVAASLHEAAIVLLKNDSGMLPLAADCRLRVAAAQPSYLRSALQAQGFSVEAQSLDQVSATQLPAQTSEVAVVCIGDQASPSDSDFAAELQLLERLAEQRMTTVVVLGSDAVDLATRVPDSVGAVVIAWDFGIGSARAVAGVLSGSVNPSGRLPFALHSAGSAASAADSYDFGHGLSFSHFEYRELLCGDTVDTHGAVEVTLEVINESAEPGVEVVQLYCHDPVAETTRPRRQLIGFHRLALAAGQSKRLVFQLDVSQFAYYNRRLEYVVESGVIELLAGSSSRDVRSRTRLNVQGDVRVFKQQQRLATQPRELELSP